MSHTSVSVTRRRYICDLATAMERARDRRATDDYNPDVVADSEPLYMADDDPRYNLVSSLLHNGKHSPALDIDIPIEVVASSTDGHSHLYFPSIELTWSQYRNLLWALAEARIISNAYCQYSIGRGQTLLRPPHVAKGDPTPPTDGLRTVSETVAVQRVQRNSRAFRPTSPTSLTTEWVPTDVQYDSHDVADAVDNARSNLINDLIAVGETVDRRNDWVMMPIRATNHTTEYAIGND